MELAWYMTRKNLTVIYQGVEGSSALAEWAGIVTEHPKKRRSRAKSTKTLQSDMGLDQEEGAEGDQSGPQTQLARDIYQNRARFPHCILLTRVGQFYEV